MNKKNSTALNKLLNKLAAEFINPHSETGNFFLQLALSFSLWMLDGVTISQKLPQADLKHDNAEEHLMPTVEFIYIWISL